MLRVFLRLAAPILLLSTPAAAAPAATGHTELVRLFDDWRAFNHPAIVRGRPDYSARAMAAKATSSRPA